MSDEKPDKLSKYWVRQEPSPLEVKGFRDYVEEQIQEAMAQGKFNNLPGKGKPLKLGQDNPYEQQDWMVNHVLSNAHYVPEWVLLEREVTAGFQWLREHPGHPERAERIEVLNQLIDKFNLAVPAGWMQKPRYRDDRST